MGIQSKLEYLNSITERYRKAKRKEKKSILDEFCINCGYNRKYAIRLLRKPSKKARRKRGRKSLYNSPVLLKAIRTIWINADQPCSKRLLGAIRDWLPFYEEDYEVLSSTDREKLLKISAATLDRHLKPIREKVQRKRLCTTRPGTLLKNQIPIKTNHWDVTKPGFVEADTVAHCGNSIEGDYAHSLTMTDILTTWTENRAVWNKGAEGVLKQVQNIENALPFPLLGFDADNGSEFINHHLQRHFASKSHDVQFTRSRPYKKNDNAYVEQKNWTHVRHLFGYERFDNPDLVPLMNDLYANEWSLYQNHFCSAMKIKEKVKVNSKYRKRYDKPKTPYQRVLECPDVSEEKKNELRAIHQSLNPFKLKRVINAKAKAIFRSVTLSAHPRQCI
jgi:hypothetical protein